MVLISIILLEILKIAVLILFQSSNIPKQRERGFCSLRYNDILTGTAIEKPLLLIC